MKIRVDGLSDTVSRLQATPKAIKTATVRAVNKTANSTAAKSAKTLAEKTTLKSRYIKSRIYVQKAGGTRQKDVISAAIAPSKSGVPLEEYKFRKTRDGITVTYSKERGPVKIKAAFVRRDKAGVWKRVPAQEVTAELRHPAYPQLGFVSVQATPTPEQPAPQVRFSSGCQRWGSSSCRRLAGRVGRRVRTSLR